ncbi:MAG TPA: CPBP family glutamic-type intramembrane protease [Caulobacteraceae bacterium]
MQRLTARMARAVTTWPDARGWAFTAAVGAASLAAMAAIGFSSGLYAVHPARTQGLPLRLLTVLIAPAIGEEALFRGLLIPDRTETLRPWSALAAVTGVFTLWHVVEAKTFLRVAEPMFLRPSFLACAASLGLGCGLIRWRTASLWPVVAVHWLAVILWQTWLGGLVLDD